MSRTADKAGVRLRVWDFPTRAFHWLLVCLVAFSWWTAESGMLGWHKISGLTIFGLILFRIYWGFAGSTTARFASFVRGPSAFLDHARRLFRRAEQPYTGHNAMGGWSVLALLVLLLSQTVLGFFAVDVDGIESGPLSYLVSFETGRLAAAWHERVFDAFLIVVAVHIFAVLFYLVVRREDLIVPMITGYKRFRTGAVPSLDIASGLRAIVGLAIAGVVAFGIASGLRF